MITVLHGENIVQSREELIKIIDEARPAKKDVLRIEAKELTLADLEQILGNENLFGTEQLVIIEGLHSLPKSKKKDELIGHLAKIKPESSTIKIVLWEKRELTPTMLKKIVPKKELSFKLTNQLFKWLDSLSPENKTKKNQLNILQSAVIDNGEHMCFLMLIRQIRLLIQAKNGGNLKGAPFMIAKLKKQANFFDLEKLLELHKKLLKIDIAQKTSKNKLSLDRELDLLVINL